MQILPLCLCAFGCCIPLLYLCSRSWHCATCTCGICTYKFILLSFIHIHAGHVIGRQKEQSGSNLWSISCREDILVASLKPSVGTGKFTVQPRWLQCLLQSNNSLLKFAKYQHFLLQTLTILVYLYICILAIHCCGGHMYRLTPASSCVTGYNRGGHSYHPRAFGPLVIWIDHRGDIL